MTQGITTQRLHLVAATAETLEAELTGRDALAEALGCAVPDAWPPELYDRRATLYTLDRLAEGPGAAGWWLYYMLLVEHRLLIGTCGYKGPPDEQGRVEIGYGVLEHHRRRGYAIEAARGLVDRAFADRRVAQVIAETLPHLIASIGLLERLGFRFEGTGSSEGVIRYVLDRAH